LTAVNCHGGPAQPTTTRLDSVARTATEAGLATTPSPLSLQTEAKFCRVSCHRRAAGHRSPPAACRRLPSAGRSPAEATVPSPPHRPLSPTSVPSLSRSLSLGIDRHGRRLRIPSALHLGRRRPPPRLGRRSVTCLLFVDNLLAVLSSIFAMLPLLQLNTLKSKKKKEKKARQS
jgi:hypothetical protein